MKICIRLMCIALLSACSVSRQLDITNRSLPTQYKVGDVFRTARSLAIIRGDYEAASHLGLEIAVGEQLAFPPNVRVERGSFVGLVSPGSTVEITRFALLEKSNFGEILFAIGHIVEGPFAGLEVDLTFVSHQHMKAGMAVPDPDPANLVLLKPRLP
jgi:hypothetical protein